ncbi:hypothetical protein J0H58_03025 [bacterium]|nr:hypothetical protein [bacterium]
MSVRPQTLVFAGLSIVGMTMLGAVGLLVVFAPWRSNTAADYRPEPAYRPVAKDPEELMLAEVRAYFEGQKRGEQYPGVKSFNTCRGYAVVSVQCFPDVPESLALPIDQGGRVKAAGTGTVVARVEYSDARGVPLVRDWKVLLYLPEGSTAWTIYAVEP